MSISHSLPRLEIVQVLRHSLLRAVAWSCSYVFSDHLILLPIVLASALTGSYLTLSSLIVVLSLVKQLSLVAIHFVELALINSSDSVNSLSRIQVYTSCLSRHSPIYTS